jgi:L-malate glycosyltransferase
VKKRVLQLIGSFHLGGSERQGVTLTRMLHNEGTYDVSIATLNNDGVLRTELGQLGSKDIPEFRLTSFYNANFVREVRRFASYLKENGIDLIHTHDFYTNVFGMAAGSLAGVESRVASKRETNGMRSRSQDLIEGLAFGRAHAVVVNAEAVRDHLARHSIPTAKIKVIYNGIDTKRFSVTEEPRVLYNRLGLPGETKIVTLAANLRHDVKNVPMLLRAAKSVAASVADAHFVIAGEGELEGQLKQMAEQLGVSDRVTFIGSCSDMPSLLAASSVCVLTSNAEGFSNSILEYMAAGKPVVATRVGGAAEVIEEGINGFLVEPDDDTELAKHLIALLEDNERMAAMGAAARLSVVERFSCLKQLERTVELYDSLLSSH